MAENQEELIVEIWKKVIDVQQHFNDIELRIRNMAITLSQLCLVPLHLLFRAT